MIKRIFDIFLSLVGLIFIFPFLILLILISKLDTENSGIFSQERVGKDGKKFNLFKIRSMKIDEKINTVVTTKNDIRITKLGSILRKFKLDELPQLWNVLIGDMSFVGPRPEVDEYIRLVPKALQKKILSVRPGITGPASIKYRNEENLLELQKDPEKYNEEIIFPDKIKINLNYVENNNLISDIYYIYKTIIR
tara:strand:+ start:135 stop:716 length:582 start_codon:yes stop_codon:yes gene_type:complete